MIAKLIPTLAVWWALPTGFVVEWVAIPAALRWSLLAMAAGVFLSGLRDVLRGAQTRVRRLALVDRNANGGQKMIARRRFHRVVFAAARRQ
jgi:hypothetical protein